MKQKFRPLLLGIILIFRSLSADSITEHVSDSHFPAVFCPFLEEDEDLINQLFPLPKHFTVKDRVLHNNIVEKSINLEDRLNNKIFGQQEAVKETVNAILRFAAGVNEDSVPIASLLYCGPSGVGKTELAKQLCVELYGSDTHFTRINMSEYVESHSISRLIGSPPGYIGYEGGGTLSNRLLACPYSVVLLDEIEKGHPKILKLFMHVFDAGYFTSAQGKDIDCSNAIFILTSNLAAAEIAEMHEMGKSKAEILEELQPYFMDTLSPELYNRVDCMIFSPLTDEIRERLVRKILNELAARVYQSKSIQILFDTSLIDYLMSFSLDPKLGARPLKRFVDRKITTRLAKAILENACSPEDILLCSYADENLVLEVLLQSD